MKVKTKTKRRAAYLRAITRFQKSLREAELFGDWLVKNRHRPLVKQMRRSIMGYRSDVAMCIQGRTPEKFREFCVQLKLWANAEHGGHLFTDWSSDSWGWNDKFLIFYVQSVKWYDDHPDVRRIQSLWEFASSYAGKQEGICAGISGTFVRVGDDLDDISEENFGADPPWDYCRVIRSVEVNDTMPLGERNNEVLGEYESEEKTNESA